MRTFLILSLLAASTLAGCAQETPVEAEPAAKLDITIIVDPDAPTADWPVHFDIIVRTPVAGDSLESVVWKFSDADVTDEPKPVRAFAEGNHSIIVQVRSNGTGLNQETLTLSVQAANGTPPPAMPAPVPPTPGNPEPQTPGIEPDWGTPTDHGIRPGVNIVTGGSGCTTSFLFTDNWNRFFLSTAAHCVASGGSSDTNGCTAPISPLGTKSTIYLDNGGTVNAPLAYASWNTMQEKGAGDDACAGNDFALLEIPSEHWDKMHPASLHFLAPTGLATSGTSQIWGYGASSLKFGIEPAHPKQGVHLGTANGGWSHLVYLGTPGIPGDSGGHIMTQDGQALGVASTVLIAPYPGANHYTDLAKSVAYVEAETDLELQLITWDDFNASLT